VLDQRGIADRFLSEGQVAQVTGFASTRLDISDFPTRHNYGLALWQNDIERILAGWIAELEVPIHRELEVTGFAQDDTGVDVEVSDGRSLRAKYLVGCDRLIAVYGTDYGVHSPARSRGSPTGPGRPRPTARDVCCWPATPHTFMHRMVGRASTPGCRML
jgi:2-polyprenyl-6-methoxyphenol hydroxylase-like FAD-dependent oxidoreductase